MATSASAWNLQTIIIKGDEAKWSSPISTIIQRLTYINDAFELESQEFDIGQFKKVKECFKKNHELIQITTRDGLLCWNSKTLLFL